MKILVPVVTAIFVLLLTCNVNGGGERSANAEVRVNQTLNGLIEYYWNNDPKEKDIMFFFACGQIGGQGSSNWKKCSCYDKTSCLNCYRWWDAVAIESLATYGIYSNTTKNSQVPETIFNHSPYNANYYGKTFIDDFAWYGIAYLRVYEWLKDEKWLNRSIDLYNWAWENGWDDPCGGFWWSTWPGQQFKDSVTIMEMLHFSSKLAFMYPKDSDYIKHAEKIWNWIYSFNNGTGLLTEKNLVSTGAMPELCCNSSTKILLKKCYSSKLSGTSYNQGLLLSSSAYLYSLTANEVYLDTGVKLLNAVLQNYTTTDGILIDEPRSGQTFRSQCVGGADPGGDWYSFNGIFMLHLAYFSDILSAKKALNGNMLAKIKMFVQNTSDAAWARSAVWPPFKEEDACDAGVKSKSNFPKFHWWWGEEKTRQILPPDSGLYLHKTYLRCVGAGTQLWDGPMYTEDKCEKKCSKNKLCSKYLFSTDQYHCWIWSYNRTNHICNQTDSDFNVGVKRPLGHASCKGICGSHKPQKLKHGVCYCDSNCTKHLDCCLDYAEECVQDSDYLSCQGFCKKAHAQAIRGGGYCWCFDGCNPNFTDNNSMGSCCPDYPEKCLGVNMPTCMDARSQGSALNLFLAHLKISNL